MTEMEKWLAANATASICEFTGRKCYSGDPISLRDYDVRYRCVSQFAFPILTAEMVSLIVAHSPLLEIGCGIGYWAYELRRAGADIVPTSLGEPFCLKGVARQEWLPIEQIEASDAVRKYPDRTLLITWPSAGPWASDALECFRGRTLIYAGEGSETCADEDFFSLIEDNFDFHEISMPVWFGMHDHCYIHMRNQ